VAQPRKFGVSTHLFHTARLGREHLLEVASQGFDTIELFATRTHFDYHHEAAVADLQQWLGEAGLELGSVHAPIGEGFAAGRWGASFSLASTDASARAKALAEAEHALHIARRLPFAVLVVHLGLPRSQHPAPADNGRDAARRSIERLRERAASLGVKLAVEVIANELSRSGSLVHFVEEVLDEPVGICLDFGHAHLEGDLVEAIETVSEHLVAVDLHDNRGRFDEHLVPFEGTIDWAGALTAVQKVGFEGPLVLELAPHGSIGSRLAQATKARQRMERLLAD
jgi:sugar phosphate isomerase/epimerase